MTKKNIERISTSNYYLVYLDILGTKEFVNNDIEDKFLNDLNVIYNRAKNSKNNINEWNNIHINAKIFSDNILLFIKADNNDTDNQKIMHLIFLASAVYCEALENGYLMRGSITFGKFCYNELFVYGKALTDAVKLEEEIAIYPRIVIQKSINYKSKDILKDNDEILYLDNYSAYIGIAFFSKAKTQLLNLLKTYKEKEKIRQKIFWSINYHNKFCNKWLNTGRFAGDPRITDKETEDALK